MKIIESQLSKHIVKSDKIRLGEIHFFNHLAIIEFNEGVHVNLNNVDQIHKKLSSFYGESRPFGVIANRVNSYSIDLLDVSYIKKIMNNLCAYSIISHNSASAMNADIENKFCSSEKIHFKNIHEGVLFVYSKVKSKTLLSLN
jgi:hypothetical protein